MAHETVFGVIEKLLENEIKMVEKIGAKSIAIEIMLTTTFNSLLFSESKVINLPLSLSLSCWAIIIDFFFDEINMNLPLFEIQYTVKHSSL